jgi:hypothetical protein
MYYGILPTAATFPCLHVCLFACLLVCLFAYLLVSLKFEQLALVNPTKLPLIQG